MCPPSSFRPCSAANRFTNSICTCFAQWIFVVFVLLLLDCRSRCCCCCFSSIFCFFVTNIFHLKLIKSIEQREPMPQRRTAQTDKTMKSNGMKRKLDTKYHIVISCGSSQKHNRTHTHTHRIKRLSILTGRQNDKQKDGRSSDRQMVGHGKAKETQQQHEQTNKRKEELTDTCHESHPFSNIIIVVTSTTTTTFKYGKWTNITGLLVGLSFGLPVTHSCHAFQSVVIHVSLPLRLGWSVMRYTQRNSLGFDYDSDTSSDILVICVVMSHRMCAGPIVNIFSTVYG